MITPKAWGFEFEIANIHEEPYDYCSKKMFLREQYRCSIHHHKIKDEVLMVGNEEGLVYFETGQDPSSLSGVFMKFNDRVRLRPGIWHRFTGLRDSWIYEASSHHEDTDSYRSCSSGKVGQDDFRSLLESYFKDDNSDRVLTLDGAKAIASLLHRDHRLVGMSNGCFDLMHLGHAAFLQEARQRCEVLFVAVNTDSAVTKLKGAGRPFVDERGRIGMVASNKNVDYVVICEGTNCLDVVDAVRPNVYVTTEEYGRSGPEAREVVSQGGVVEVVSMIDGYNTTDLAKKIMTKR